MAVKTSELLTYPKPGTVIPVREYTPEQRSQIAALEEVGRFQHVQIYYQRDFLSQQYVRSLLLPESDPYYIWEKRWIESPGTIARYMRAAKWRLDDAQKRIRGTLEWRREYKPDLIPPEEVRIESETGKM